MSTPARSMRAVTTWADPRSSWRGIGAGPTCAKRGRAPASANSSAVSRPSTPAPSTAIRPPDATTVRARSASPIERMAMTPPVSSGSRPSRVGSRRSSPLIAGTVASAPVASTSWSYGTRPPSPSTTSRAPRSIRAALLPESTRTPRAARWSRSAISSDSREISPVAYSAIMMRLYGVPGSAPITVSERLPSSIAGSSSSANRTPTGPNPTRTTLTRSAGRARRAARGRPPR